MGARTTWFRIPNQRMSLSLENCSVERSTFALVIQSLCALRLSPAFCVIFHVFHPSWPSVIGILQQTATRFVPTFVPTIKCSARTELVRTNSRTVVRNCLALQWWQTGRWYNIHNNTSPSGSHHRQKRMHGRFISLCSPCRNMSLLPGTYVFGHHVAFPRYINDIVGVRQYDDPGFLVVTNKHSCVAQNGAVGRRF